MSTNVSKSCPQVEYDMGHPTRKPRIVCGFTAFTERGSVRALSVNRRGDFVGGGFLWVALGLGDGLVVGAGCRF